MKDALDITQCRPEAVSRRSASAPRSSCPSASGDVDYRAIFGAAKQAGIKHFLIEQDNAAEWGDSLRRRPRQLPEPDEDFVVAELPRGAYLHRVPRHWQLRRVRMVEHGPHEVRAMRAWLWQLMHTELRTPLIERLHRDVRERRRRADVPGKVFEMSPVSAARDRIRLVARPAAATASRRAGNSPRRCPSTSCSIQQVRQVRRSDESARRGRAPR